MKKRTWMLPVVAASVAAAPLLLTGCTAPAPEPESHRAVVIVSGGDAVSPFTTPDEACASGLAAGNTDTALRESLLAAGLEVYTAPAMNARSAVVEPDADSFGAFGDCPIVLPAYMTIVSDADIDNAGEHLAHFAEYLHTEYGVTEIDWVGHSNGGLFARAATRILQETGAAVQATSLATVATPWVGSEPFRIAYGELPGDACASDAICEALAASVGEETASGAVVLGREQLHSYLLGENGWNAAQLGVLDGIPVRMIGGTYLQNPAGDPQTWPFDGMVSESSAFGRGLPEQTAPLRSCSSYPYTHSIFISDALGLDWQTALTWNTDVLAEVAGFIGDVRAGVVAEAGAGC